MKTLACFLLPILALTMLFCSGNADTQEKGFVTIQNDQLSVKISTLGAELQSIRHNQTGREYLWQGDPEYWSGRSPVMFPVNVRFKDNRFTYKGIEYEMPRMGLAISNTFTALPSTNGDQAVLEFASSPETLTYYPFSFRLEITYRLEGNTLVNQFRVENTGEDTMYFALGGHPGFRFPYDEKQDRPGHQYTFSEKMTVSRIEILESLVQHTLIPFLENEDRLSLGDTRIPANGSGMFLKEVSARQIGIALADEPPFVTVDLGDFPNVNLWTPPGYPYACIEPMLSHHDLVDASMAIENKNHLIALPGGDSGVYRYSIIIQE